MTYCEFGNNLNFAQSHGVAHSFASATDMVHMLDRGNDPIVEARRQRNTAEYSASKTKRVGSKGKYLNEEKAILSAPWWRSRAMATSVSQSPVDAQLSDDCLYEIFNKVRRHKAQLSKQEFDLSESEIWDEYGGLYVYPIGDGERSVYRHEKARGRRRDCIISDKALLRRDRLMLTKMRCLREVTPIDLPAIMVLARVVTTIDPTVLNEVTRSEKSKSVSPLVAHDKRCENEYHKLIKTEEYESGTQRIGIQQLVASDPVVQRALNCSAAIGNATGCHDRNSRLATQILQTSAEIVTGERLTDELYTRNIIHRVGGDNWDANHYLRPRRDRRLYAGRLTFEQFREVIRVLRVLHRDDVLRTIDDNGDVSLSPHILLSRRVFYGTQ